METTHSVKLISLKMKSTYEAFTTAFEASLGKMNMPALQKAGHDAAATEAAIHTMQGEEGMTLFSVDDFGKLLSINGPERKAKRFFVGNYARASQIISKNLRLGLYAPLKVLVYEAEDKTVHVEYELPSSVFARLNDELITQSGLGLDEKLKNLIALADARGQDNLS